MPTFSLPGVQFTNEHVGIPYSWALSYFVKDTCRFLAGNGQ